MIPRALRALPALLASALFVLAAGTPAVRTAPAPSVPAASSSVGTCAGTIQSGIANGGAGTFAGGIGFTQPLVDSDNLVSSSLGFVVSGYTNGAVQHTVFAWDPLSLVPSPVTVALRTTTFGISTYAFNGSLTADYSPAIVRREQGSVAEAMPPGLALDWFPLYWNAYGGSNTVPYDTSAVPLYPVAYSYMFATPRTALPGLHPVLAHSACYGDSAMAALSVVQSVVRTDSLLATNVLDVLQTFRVPLRTRVHWIEYAESQVYNANSNLPGWLALIDASNPTSPPQFLPAPLVQAYVPFLANGGPSQWSAHLDFDHTVDLEPNHDYWLLVHTNFWHRLYARRLTGGEGVNFTSAIGPLWLGTGQPNPWLQATGCALDFRVVGEVLPELPPPASGRLALRALENPVRGSASIGWSGAQGALRFAVLDVRGRRVSSGVAAANASGQWLWTATHDDGKPLPSGVYFVRVTDAAGATASLRIVLVR